MINFIKTIVKSNRILIILAEKISTYLKINFEEEYKIASFLKRPVIIDVGAHLGESINGFLKYSKHSKIYSFEPNEKLYKKICHSYNQNKQITIYNLAISNKKINHLYCPRLFGINLSLWSTFSKSYLQQRWTDFTGINFKKLNLAKFKIKSSRLDNFKLSPQIIKIDAEGCELEVIKSAKKTIKKNLPILIVEFHHKNFNKIRLELKKLDYIFYKFQSNNNFFVKINKKNLEKIVNKTTSTNIIFYSKKSKLLKKKFFK
tara:strand:+ start:739 stop:1518 length:780 start_codon:yes stop_codon:yes gene_type:complete